MGTVINTLEGSTYTAFISYAHADDVRCHNWVSLFAAELQRGLGAVMRGVTLPPVHLSGDNGPVAGELGIELRERIDKSFAMVVVVHDNYVLSEWCAKELAYFKQRFGERGCQERLFIVALSEPAVQQAASGPAWRAALPPTQVWMPFFDELQRGEPVDIYMAPQLVTPVFKQMFKRLREAFVARLRAGQAPAHMPIAAGPVVGAPAAAPAQAAALQAAAQQDVHIYIESNRHELDLWRPLGEQMRRRWARLTASTVAGALAGAAPGAAAQTPAHNVAAGAASLHLRARGLPVEHIDQFPSLDDADGVVLLWGKKTPDALVAQINKVENKMSPGRDAAPGVVAYLMPPQAAAEPVPAWGWQVLRFDARTHDGIDVVTEEDAALEGFLRRVLERRLLRLEAAGSGGAGR